MEKPFIEKMIRNCLYQYQHTVDSVPLSKNDYEELYEQILVLYKQDNEDLHEIVQDVVYEYLTNQ
ncbi:YqzH family protein [Bacillus sp. DJP31]|uniref:YqzH family protein n=1 Tax=Bacillus sp. DJP31 TaxID=3409789 RepID=UPI003BB65F80